MVNRRAGIRGIGLITWLAAAALIHAQVPTPTINGPNATPPGLQSSQQGVSNSCLGPTNGAAITAATAAGSGICLYINGSFNNADHTNIAIWTDANGPQELNSVADPSNSQLVVLVPSAFFAVAETATITVRQFVNDNQGVNGVNSNPATFTVNPVLAGVVMPSGLVGVAYAQPFFSGGTGPFAPTAATFPPGLAYTNPNGDVLQGTPTTAGNFSVSAQITDAWLNIITLNEPISIFNVLLITTAALPAGRVTSAYNTGLAGSGGALPYLWSATGLPPGLVLNAASGAITGTPTASGNFSVNVTLTDGSRQTALATLGIVINPPPVVVTTTLLPNATVGVLYSGTISAIGGNGGPYTFTASTALPAGLLLANNGMLQGTPTAPGTFSLGVTASDSTGSLGLGTVSLTIGVNPLLITTGVLSNVQAGNSVGVTFAASGGVAPYSFSLTGTAPPGASFSGATLSGTVTTPGSYTFTITVTDVQRTIATKAFTLLVTPAPLTITTTGLPTGRIYSAYSAGLAGSGGIVPYTWSATGLPAGLGLNAASGAISGVPSVSGSFSVSVTLMDSGAQTARATFGITISPPPPVQITTGSLPNATVGIFYSGAISATGGNGGPYTFSGAGSLPPGLQVANNGLLQGTPTTPGTYSFSVTATDSTGNGGSGTVSITVGAAPLIITTGSLSNVQVGSLLGVTFAASGGIAPYTFSLTGSTPPGTSFSNAALGGTVTTAGSYTFTVTVTDSVKSVATKTFTLVVTPGPLTISASLPTGPAGTAYSGQFSATGGTAPYTWSGTAGGGLSVSASGAVTGTPTVAGTFTVSVTVTDSLGAKATGTYSVTIGPSSLLITTSSLSSGALTSPYSAGLSATGGTPPYSWSASGLPAGLSAAANGSISGTPTSPGAFTVSVTVKDSAGASASANLALTILPAPLKITTTGITSPTLGQSFSSGFGATGGAPPYTWSATGLPGGVTITPTGTLSGTPTALATTAITVTVTDSTGTQATETLNLTVILPAPPAVTLGGLPPTAPPATQSTTSVTFGATYPVAVTVNLTLTFVPLSGADDPNIQFSTGGRKATLTIPAGSTISNASIGVQTGTVAGTITITSQLVASGQDITPTPPPTKTIVIAPAAPAITSATATTNSTGFTVTIDGFDTTRAITQVIFTFTPAAGSTLQTTTSTVSASALFSSWYQSSASAAYGSQFSFTIPFTVTGNVSGIGSVTVTLVNPTGTSTSTTVSL